jgi:predicted nucleotidyltransferase
MPDATRLPTYAEIQARHLAAHRRRALAAARAAAAEARAAGARLLVFGSLAAGGFHRGSDLDLALDGPTERLPDLAASIAGIAAAHGVAVDVVRLDQAPPRLAARIRDQGRDPAGLE